MATSPTTPAPERSPRGVRTREALVRAAREVFERDGFLDARIVDIARAAGVATGSFYTYFEGKDEVFAAVMAHVQEEMLHPRLPDDVRHDDPIVLIEATNRAYLEAYRRNAKLMALMEQVATISEDFRLLRLERAAAFAERNARGIRRLQEQGLADAALDPLLAANATSSMVSRMANQVFVHGYEVDFEDLVRTLTRLWANALRVPTNEES